MEDAVSVLLIGCRRSTCYRYPAMKLYTGNTAARIGNGFLAGGRLYW